MLEVKGLTGGYSSCSIVKDVSLTVQKGEILGILGPNGSGKTTLLKLMSGAIPASTGEVMIGRKQRNLYRAKELAKMMAVLPQLHTTLFSSTVRETVALGRYPHQSGLLSSWTEEDEQAVQFAMEQTKVIPYEHTQMDALSGGEQQRAFIAQALAQHARLLLLDEPTNHLDIAHQKQIFDMLRKQADEENVTIVTIFHDINLAALYCDHLLLLEQGRVVAYGAPHEIIQKEKIEEVYTSRIATYAHPEVPKPQITMLPSQMKRDFIVTKKDVHITEQYVKLQVQQPLKVVSSAAHNAGVGWYTTILNRTITPNYCCENVKEEMIQFLMDENLLPTNTVMMLTALPVKHVAIQTYLEGKLLVVVTAGVGHAVDVAKSYERIEQVQVGTINTWVVINGQVSEEAFYQAMITATEAKTKALADADVRDWQTNTVATGTGTDSLLVAATQVGEEIPYAGPITEIGKWIGRGVYETTSKAIQNYRVDYLNSNHIQKNIKE